MAQLKIGKRGVERTPVTAKVADAAGDGASSEDSHRLALARLRDLLCTDRIGASGRLPAERLLAAELGVSRRALRHALDILEAEGRVTRHQGRGTFVTDARLGTESLVRELAKLNNPVDTLEARLAIEPPQARLAALRATPGDIDKLFEAAEASRNAKDPASYEKADAAFHRRVAAAARNPLLIAIFDAVLEIASEGSWRHGRETAHCINRQAEYAAAHRRIAVAIAARNATLAEEAMRAHLNAVQQQLIEHAFPRPQVAAE
ncbi:MAG TPA: FCD domain-containing protein [Xanthobacteraceae bacterium]|nr:FCD domain-containing protein [Xanthobacteraceae bacterium]